MTEDQIAAVFAEWHRRWVADPDSFESDAQAFEAEDVVYGKDAAVKFLKIAAEIL